MPEPGPADLRTQGESAVDRWPDGGGESRNGESVTASPFRVPIGTTLIASPARRRAISLPPRAAGPLSLPRSDQFERSGPAPRSTGSRRADRASGSWGRWRSAARGEPGACQIHSLNRGRGSVPPGRQMKVHRCP